VPRLQRHHRRVIPQDRHSRTSFEEMSSTGRPQYWPSVIPIGSKTPLLQTIARMQKARASILRDRNELQARTTPRRRALSRNRRWSENKHRPCSIL
jgi:hypothetical protein